jgi:hypothetical protein
MAELGDFTVTSSIRLTKQVKQYEPVVFESKISATYLSNDESEIDEKQKILNEKCLQDIANQMKKFFKVYK